eukprot:1146740-Pleurochrysis_carterae.AAC.1
MTSLRTRAERDDFHSRPQTDFSRQDSELLMPNKAQFVGAASGEEEGESSEVKQLLGMESARVEEN